jgi:hypothetical protein
MSEGARISRLGFARQRMRRAYDSTCDVLRSGVAIYSAIPCMVEVPGDSNQQLEGQSIPVGAFLLSLPVEYPLQEQDYVVERGRTLEVIRVVTPKSYQVRMTALCINVGGS